MIGWTAPAAGLALALLAGCFGMDAPAGGSDLGAEDPHYSAGAFVLDREDLAGARGSLLEAMIGRVPGLQVSPTGRCPALAIRGANTVPGLTDPRVYVDGTRALDTCILDDLRALDVERVEVYSSGSTTRPGYEGSSHGLILVFLRRA